MGAYRVDVAIVGGGVAGMYAAWRLLTESPLSPSLQALANQNGGRLNVALYEYSDRVGGRLFSLRMPGVPSLPAELGGMRFLNTHRRVLGLVNQFKLERRILPVEDPNQKGLYYLRGKHFEHADWDKPGFSPPYNLGRSERMRTPGQLLINVALKYQRQADQLRDVGFWNLLLREYSDEAYRLLRDAGGYETIINNWSAAEAIPFLLADFAPGSTYYALNNGLQTLPKALAQRFRRAGGQVHLEHRLHRIDWDGDLNEVRLVFQRGGGVPFENRQEPSREDEQIVSARHVILAMPRRSIELLHDDSVIFRSQELQGNMRTVLPQPAFKIFAAYRRPWWRESRGVSAGRSLTDLPVRQCYYWGTESDGPGGTRGCQNSLLMASYNDGSAVEFWSGLARHSDRYSAPVSSCPPGVGIPEHVRELSASAPLVRELQEQLMELHGLDQIQEQATSSVIAPYAVVYQDWTKEPFGGGWHFWKIGVDSRQVMDFMRHPIATLPLYICGEAWSRQQGWVEGALETADDVLVNVLGLSPFVDECEQV